MGVKSDLSLIITQHLEKKERKEGELASGREGGRWCFPATCGVFRPDPVEVKV